MSKLSYINPIKVVFWNIIQCPSLITEADGLIDMVYNMEDVLTNASINSEKGSIKFFCFCDTVKLGITNKSKRRKIVFVLTFVRPHSSYHIFLVSKT